MISKQQIETLKRDGVVVLPGIVPAPLCAAVIQAIEAFTGIDREQPASWYQQDFSGHGIVPLHHHQALWDLRQHPSIHAVFARIYAQQALWVSVDRVSYKPPLAAETEAWQRSPVHWDTDPWRQQAQTYQGLVYLTDTDAEQGAFACVPDIYRDLPRYLEQHRHEPHRQQPQYTESQLQPISGQAGSLVVFSRFMPHTSLRNVSSAHRFVQYVTMAPAGDDETRRRLAEDVRARRAPAWALAQNVPGQLNPEPGEALQLSPLGRRLAGLDRWPPQEREAP